MKDIEPGQVLWLKIRFNNNGTISDRDHPYLVLKVDEDLDVVEVAQVDSLKGKEFKAAMKSNKTIYSDDPDETVISKDSYAQLDNSITFEYYDDLSRFRRLPDKLSPAKFEDVLSSYNRYHETNEIDEMKIVYLDQDEIKNLNH